VGYAGGTSDNPTYGDVCSGKTGHAEVVEVQFDPSVVLYEQLLKVWFSLHDPTMDARHYRGGQYRSLVFYTTPEQEQKARKLIEIAQSQLKRPIVSLVEPAPQFWRAEEYHQKYYEKNKTRGCSV
jgi:peptide-methionine (S)-S-oxide reductase